MKTRFDRAISIHNKKQKNNNKTHKCTKHTQQRISNYYLEAEDTSNNLSKLELSQYEYKNFLDIKSQPNLSLKNYNPNVSKIRIDFALAIITKSVIDVLEIQSDSEQKELFDMVKQAFNDEKLPIRLRKSKNSVLATRSSIEESIDYMINKINIEEVKKRFNNKKSINQQEKLGIFLNTFSNNILNILPDILIGKKGNLRHGFVDKSIQAVALQTCMLFVLIDNFSSGWKNNTQEEAEFRAQSSSNYMLLALIINLGLVSIFWLARKKDENLQEDLELLNSEFDEIIQQRKDTRKVIDVIDKVIKQVHSDHNYYVYTSSVERDEVEQIAKQICNEDILEPVLERLDKAFDRAGTNKLSFESFEKNIRLVLSVDHEKYKQLKEKFESRGADIQGMSNRINDENSYINDINALNDFIIGYPKHLANKITEPCGIRFFERKHTRDRLILAKGDENTDVNQNEISSKNNL